MSHMLSLLAGAGVGAGLMFLLDPQMGRRRRALAGAKAVRLAHETQDVAGAVVEDAKNRAQGLASGDLSVLVGGKRALRNPLRGSWSPSGRTLLALGGTGLFLFGLTRNAPTACVLGTIGLALAAEGVTNAGLDDLARIPHNVKEMATNVADRIGGGESAKANNPLQRTERPEFMRV